MEKKNSKKNARIVWGVRIGIWAVAALLIVFAIFADKIFGADSFFSGLFGTSDGETTVTLGERILAFLPQLLKAVIIAFIVYAVAKLLRVIVHVILRRGQRGVTVGKLIDNFIKYAAAIIIILLVLGTLGVDTATLLASAGILGLVVGLGAQTLIADIIAGLFIVFESDFNVGDIVVIDGWRGTVKEIGIRTTKIEDVGGNVKIVNNSEITTIINQTKELSLATCVVGTEYRDSIERIESVVKDNLDGIKKRIPAIVEGPYYKGVTALGSSSVDLLFVAKCPEEDVFQVQRDLNREIKLVFDKNGISIPFPQIVLNEPPKAEIRATGKQKKAASDFVEEQKELSKGVEEETGNQ